MKNNKKQKTSSEVRHLIGENKRLQKENAQLRRMLEKTMREPREPDEPVEEPAQEVSICGECGKGELEVFEIIGRVYTTCPVCNHRERVDDGDGPV